MYRRSMDEMARFHRNKVCRHTPSQRDAFTMHLTCGRLCVCVCCACSYGQRFDMVTCTNTLSELTTDDERARVVDELWDRVAPGGVLVLVDRGNGWGFHCIQTARDALLERETARANAHQFRNLRSVGRGQSEGRGSGADGDPLTAACVVAPCAHAQKVGLRVGVGV